MAISLGNLQTSVAKWPMILALYGVGGVGKTTFAASAPDPIFIQTEDGAPEGCNFQTFGVLDSFDDVFDALVEVLTKDHEFKTLVIDSIDRFEPILWKKVADDNGWADIEAAGYGKGYVKADEYWNRYISAIKQIRNQRDMTIIQIVHESNERFDSPLLGSVSKYGFNLHKRAASIIRSESDAIGFMDFMATVIESDIGFNRKSVKAEGGGQRVIYMEERPSFIAKNRYNMPPVLSIPKGTGFELLDQFAPSAVKKARKAPAKNTTKEAALNGAQA